MIVVYKPGQSLGKRNLGGVLRAKWEDDREMILRAIKKRESKGIPLDDGDGPLTDPGEYTGDEELDGVSFEVKALSVDDIQKHGHAMSATADAIGAADGDAILDARRANRAAALAFLRAAVISIEGIGGPDGNATPMVGPLSDEDSEILWANDFAIPIVVAAQWLQHVRGEQRKNSGASQPQSSPSSTATLAHSKNGSSAVVTMTPIPVGGSA